MKKWILIMCLFCINIHANQSIDDVLTRMNTFNPSQWIDGYTDTPLESHLTPKKEDDNNWLRQESLQRIQQDKNAAFVFETKNPEISVSFKENELVYAERLLEQKDEGRLCHYEPVPCEVKTLEKQCEERAIYTPYSCTNHLEVRVHRLEHKDVKRTLIKNLNTIDLASCGVYSSSFCRPDALFQLNERCEYLDVHLIVSGKELPIIKAPTCADPTLTFTYTGNAPLLVTNIRLTEYTSEDVWTKSPCVPNDDAFCIADKAYQCLLSNQLKIIDGVPVRRPCWEETYRMQCSHETHSTCGALLEAGCSNTNSVCHQETNGHCDVLEKTFQCTEQACFPDKWVCPDTLPCMNGACDNTVTEEASHEDFQAGLSQLGVLTGTADVVTNDQIQSKEARIFKGDVLACHSYLWGSRDCCFDKGFLDELIHCPAEMQVLQRAKTDNRAVFIGAYKDEFYKTRHVYCIFPTKLAAIIQKEGRKKQLGISFGEAKSPDCRGITPQEIARIQFDALDLSSLVDEFTMRTQVPSQAEIEKEAHQKATQSYEQGKSHD